MFTAFGAIILTYYIGSLSDRYNRFPFDDGWRIYDWCLLGITAHVPNHGHVLFYYAACWLL